MEGFEQDKVHRGAVPCRWSCWVVALLAIGHLQGPDKFNGGRLTGTIPSLQFSKSTASR